MPAGRPNSLDIVEISHTTVGAKVFFNQLQREAPEAATLAQRDVASQLLKDTYLYVPVLSGDLKKSGRVEEEISYDNAMRVASVVYGSPEIVYAAIQHDGDFNHPSLGFRGPALYLLKPLAANAFYYMELMTKRFNHYLSKRMEKY